MSDLEVTRRSLHGVAELLLAGPQHARSGTIRLRVTPAGFGTVAEPELRVEGTRLVHPGGLVELDSRTPVDVAEEAGIAATSLVDVYSDGHEVLATDVLRVHAGSAAVLSSAFEIGDAAMRVLAPDETPVLWPEHFDVGISVDEVNYGVSPGDTYCATPYAYVGPWALRRGDFWTAPFGAVRPWGELGGLDDVVAFFTEGRERAAHDPPA